MILEIPQNIQNRRAEFDGFVQKNEGKKFGKPVAQLAYANYVLLKS